MSEIYVYWRVASAKLQPAERVARTFLDGLRARHPGLRVRLLRRDDAEAGRATLMEVYSHAQGIDDALRASIVDAGAQALGGWAEGGRHVEAFVPVSL